MRGNQLVPLGCVITALRMTSEPVPLVVGTAIMGCVFQEAENKGWAQGPVLPL
jgi:hypothetical protein